MDNQRSNGIDFEYDDTDTHYNELAELYSYTEFPELQLNLKAFEDQMELYNLRPFWQNLSDKEQKFVVLNLLDQLEVSNKVLRMKAARSVLYLAQGCWAEVQSDIEQGKWMKKNVMLLYECGIFTAFTELLNIEIEKSLNTNSIVRKLAISLADSADLRVIISVMYIIVEIMREELKNLGWTSEYKRNVECFKEELLSATGDDMLVMKLFKMIESFSNANAPYFPIKKVLLLLWKILLITLGGIDTLRELKKKYREEAGLSNVQEDTIEVAKTLRPSSPPTNATDLLDSQNQRKNNKPFRRQSLIKQSSLDEPNIGGLEFERDRELLIKNDSGVESNENDLDEGIFLNQPMFGTYQNYYEDQNQPPEPRVNTPPPAKTKVLPWSPKVRQKDVDMFLNISRLKFVGYRLSGDSESLAGLPYPIHEGLQTLKRHMYTSLSEIQIQKEDEIIRNPLSTPEPFIRQSPTETLYQAMLPSLQQYMIALLKILLAAAPTSKSKSDGINVMADVLPEEMPMTVLQSMKLGIDVNRHKEIIVKAVSAILLLLAKHFKLNHIYQFEYMAQQLVFANCIPLILKFFNQNVLAYVESKNIIPILDFPMCVIGDQPELTTENLELNDTMTYSWRNVYTCINLLRVLNKLMKWKHSRIMMLVVFKSAPILKRTLKVMHGMLQLYVLKLLKMQTKYLGRQWRKTNMKTISVIYSKVRHRLNDDWAFGNDLEARPWDFQEEERMLRASLDVFNNRRYNNSLTDEDFVPVDNSIQSVLGVDIVLPEEFKQHYELWLQQEVFEEPINWDELLNVKVEVAES